MPLTEKGEKTLRGFKQEYGSEKGESVFYASINSGRLKGMEKDAATFRRSVRDALARGLTVTDALGRGVQVVQRAHAPRFADAVRDAAAKGLSARDLIASALTRSGGLTVEKRTPTRDALAELRDKWGAGRRSRDQRANNLPGEEETGVGAESWVGNHSTGYRINSGDRSRRRPLGDARYARDYGVPGMKKGERREVPGHSTATANGFHYQGTGSSGSHVFKHASGAYMQVHQSPKGYTARVTRAGHVGSAEHSNPDEAVHAAIHKVRMGGASG